MHHKPLGGRAPPDPLGELTALPIPSSWNKGWAPGKREREGEEGEGVKEGKDGGEKGWKGKGGRGKE